MKTDTWAKKLSQVEKGNRGLKGQVGKRLYYALHLIWGSSIRVLIIESHLCNETDQCLVPPRSSNCFCFYHSLSCAIMTDIPVADGGESGFNMASVGIVQPGVGQFIHHQAPSPSHVHPQQPYVRPYISIQYNNEPCWRSQCLSQASNLLRQIVGSMST